MTTQLAAPNRAIDDRVEEPLAAHVVVLLNFIPPYQLPVLEEFAKRVRKLTVLISTPMDGNRSWDTNWGTLDVELQRTLTWLRQWSVGNSFTEANYIHVPWDTVFRLKRLSPDVIISGQLGPRSILSTCYKLLAKRTRLIFSVGLSEYTERERSRTRTLARKWQLRRCDSVIVNGRSGQRYLESLGVESSQIFRCPYATTPVFLERGSAFRPAEIAHRLLYAGRFVDCKGILPFLDVLRKWGQDHPDRTVDFDFVGEGPQEAEIAGFAMPQNVRVNVFEKTEYDQLPAVYQARGILVLPTLHDEWAMVVNEALASGMPILGSRYSQAVEDLCVEGVNGWTFRPDVGNEMEQAIDAAFATTCDELNAMRYAARESISTVTAKSSAQIMCDAVEYALKGSPRSSP
jgi:glycosyltransferase involved in cell wall biosynthesis